MNISWAKLKQMLLDKPSSKLQYIDMGGHYVLILVEGSFQLKAKIKKTSPANSNQTDFENNYKSSANQPLSDRRLESQSGQIIGSVGDRIKVDAAMSGGGNPADSPGCATISSKLRIEHDSSDINVTDSYVTLYNYSGSGKFFGTVLDFNSNKVKVRLTVDGEQIFDLKFQDIEDIARFGANKNGDDRDMCGFFRVGQADRLEFCPPCAIKYDSSVLIEAVRTTSSTKKLTDKIVFLTKES